LKRTLLRRYSRLESRTPMRRSKPMRQRSRKPRDRGALDDPAYLTYLRAQPCRAPGLPPHQGGDPHHARHQADGRGVGAGLKSRDHRAISLCREHHADIHALAGPFKGWDKARVHAWVEVQIAEQRADYLRGGAWRRSERHGSERQAWNGKAGRSAERRGLEWHGGNGSLSRAARILSFGLPTCTAFRHSFVG
jgi:hypothetical protein